MKTLLQPHYRATETRVGAETVVLAVKDTTSLTIMVVAATPDNERDFQAEGDG